jgi:hypothetical protein
MSPEAISAIRNECDRSRVARFIRLQYLGSDPIVMFVSNITGHHLGIPLADFSAASVYHHTHQSDEEFIAASRHCRALASNYGLKMPRKERPPVSRH